MHRPRDLIHGQRLPDPFSSQAFNLSADPDGLDSDVAKLPAGRLRAGAERFVLQILTDFTVTLKHQQRTKVYESVRITFRGILLK